MNRYEKDEIRRLPEQYRPLGAWGYFGYSILFNLPIIGFICLLIFCFNGSNINRRSFARSYFCGFLIFLIVTAVVLVLLFTVIGGAELSAWIQGMLGGGE